MPRSAIDLVGQRFGRLLVLERAPASGPSRNARWLCRCDCGGEKIILSNSLRRGVTDSCGCSRPYAPHALPKPSVRKLCRYCFAPLTNGAVYCDETCEDGQWAIIPTVDGSV
jgi:hypothetical protein